MAVLSVRVSPDEKSLLENAAEEARFTLSEFIRRKALEAAQLELMDRKIVTLSNEDWDAFDKKLAGPAEAIPELKALLERRPAWEK